MPTSASRNRAAPWPGEDHLRPGKTAPPKRVFEPQRRNLAFAPIDELWRAQVACDSLQGDTALCALLKCSPKNLARYRTEGLTGVLADLHACRLGRHPVELWPDWHLDDTDIDPLLDISIDGDKPPEVDYFGLFAEAMQRSGLTV
jgi:hypothetical protein